MSAFGRHPAAFAIVAGAWLLGSTYGAQQKSSQAAPTTGAPVVFGGKTLFRIQAPVASFSPEDRARALVSRMEKLANSGAVNPASISIRDSGNDSEIVAGTVVLLAVTEADAAAAGRPRGELAHEYVVPIRTALAASRERSSIRSLLIGLLLAILSTIVLVLAFKGLRLGSERVHRKLNSWRGTRIRSVRIQRLELLPAARITGFLLATATAIRLLAGLTLLYFYLSLVFSFFPWTRGVSAALFGYVRSAAELVVTAVLTDVPNLIMVLLIALFTRFVVKFAKLIFVEIEKGTITLPGFYREWADPTYKIVRFLIFMFAAIVAFPYVPGSNSPAFRGVSIFFGLLVSLGSAGAVSNIIAGVLLTYTRAFQVGDRVKISETVGDVIEKSLLATHVRTIKNEDITVPNALVLGSHIINYSSPIGKGGLILHTSVTIGYDAPWRQVHELLIAAARATGDVMSEPAPFVLQTGLSDFYVNYEINAYTDVPARMAVIYAELHQNIQDHFNEAGVEICSPHFAALRDANQIAIPPEYVPKGYRAPAFRFRAARAGGADCGAQEASGSGA